MPKLRKPVAFEYSLTLRSPAKLNLYLKVINKRPDGFHNIQTLFERINLFDEVRFHANKTGKIRIICDHPHVPTGPKNLVYQAAEILRKNCGITKGVTIKIKKCIPVAAGLGGGSSNAATVLLGLNQIWDINLSKKQLLSYAARIGSDVSFFLYDCSWALGTGRGERIKKLDINTQLWHILVVPRVKVYTRKVYANVKIEGRAYTQGCSDNTMTPVRATGNTPETEKMNILTKKDQGVSILIRSLKKYNFSEIDRRLTNDLEKETTLLCPKLIQLKTCLKAMETFGVMVSGSGPSVFGITKTEEGAKIIKAVLKKRFSQVFAVRTF